MIICVKMSVFREIVVFLLIAAVRLLNALENVDDNALVELLRNEHHVVAFFAKSSGCRDCNLYEQELLKVSQDEEIGEKIRRFVKIENSQLIGLYATHEPAIVFFRYGVPLLYYGTVEEQAIVERLMANLDPAVIELNDQNFEHLTQATIGSTTGDFLVLFYSQECLECVRFHAKWEAVAAHFKHKLNVARLNINKGGYLTAERFQIDQLPTIILLQKGKYYRYLSNKYEIQPLIEFIDDSSFQKNNAGQFIPLEKTLITSVIDNITNYLSINRWLHKVFIFSVILFVLIIYLRKRKCANTYSELPPSQPQSPQKSERKKAQ